MSAKDTTLTSTSIRRSAWAEQLLGDAPSSAGTSARCPRDSEAEARSQQFFSQVLKNLDRLEKLTAEENVDIETGETYEWAQLVDPTGTAAGGPRLSRARRAQQVRVLPIVLLNATSFALLGLAFASHVWWTLPAAALAAATASLLYLRRIQR
jgi:hypothetical protein